MTYVLTSLLGLFAAAAIPANPSQNQAPSATAALVDYADPVEQALRKVPGGLTADEVARKAKAVSPEIAIKAAEMQKAAAQLDQTMIAFAPQLRGTAGYTRLSPVTVNFGVASGGASVGAATAGPITVGPCPQDPNLQCPLDSAGIPLQAVATPSFNFSFPLNSFSLQAVLSVPLSDYLLTLIPARKGAVAVLEAAKLARDAESLKVQTDARLAYYNWLRALAQLEVAKHALTHNQARLKDAQNAFAVGILSKADLLRLETLIATSETMVVQAESFRQLAARNIALLMGEAPREYSIGEDLFDSQPQILAKVEDPLEQLIREGLSNRLEIRSLERTVFGVSRGVAAKRAEYFPRLDGMGEVTYANPNQRFFPLQNKWNTSWSVGAQISYSLNRSLAAFASIKELKGTKRQLQMQSELLRRGVTMEVTAAYLDRQKALSAIQLGERAQSSAEEAYIVATNQFKVGQATTTDVIMAEGERMNVSLQTLNARIDLLVATTKLLYATGRLEPLKS